MRAGPLVPDDGVPRRWPRAMLLAIEATVIVVAWMASSFSYRQDMAEALIQARKSNQSKLELLVQFVSGSFISIGSVTQVLSYDSRIQNAVASNSKKAIDTVDPLLEDLAPRLGADVIWLLNADGFCIAASNYQKPESFVGIDYSDRLYFQDPKQGRRGRQFAVGRKTGLPGLFFSSPISVDGKFVGVVALKSNITKQTANLLPPGTFITDAQGVVILSLDPSLIFHVTPGATAVAMPDADRKRQYSTTRLDPIPMASANIDEYPDIIRFGGDSIPAVMSSAEVPSDGLKLYSVAQIPQAAILPARRYQQFAAAAVAGTALNLCLIGLYSWRRKYQVKLRQAQEDVESLSTRHDLILQSAGDGIVVISFDQMVTYANPAACRILRTTRDALLGSSYPAVLCGGFCDSLPDFPLPPGLGEACEQTFARADGTAFTAEYILAAMHSHDRFEGATLVFRDISLRKKYQRELERQVAERTQTILQEIELRTRSEEAMKAAQTQAMQAAKLASVGQLAAGIAHEINTPTQFIGDNLRFVGESLSTVMDAVQVADDLLKQADPGIASVFAAKVDTEDLKFLRTEMQTAVDDALSGVAQVSRIVSSMKEFSHPSTHHMTTTDINHALESTLTVSRNTWKHVAEVECRFAPDLPNVLCLAGEMNQVFLNLIVNAAQAIEESGKPFPGRITVATAFDQETVSVGISDTGNGVPESIREKIFDPFFTTKAVGKGTGQGLAICYDVVVNKHQGAITLDSVAGQGATFTVKLPLIREDAAAETGIAENDLV